MLLTNLVLVKSRYYGFYERKASNYNMNEVILFFTKKSLVVEVFYNMMVIKFDTIGLFSLAFQEELGP